MGGSGDRVTKLKLVGYETTPHRTIQGEGFYVGTPSTFLRLWGCSYSCSWCDSKKSWQEGSEWREEDVATTAAKILAFNTRHVVITGGDPLEQADGVLELVEVLQSWNRFVTVETQASIFDVRIAQKVNFLSISPKLHDWREAVVENYYLARQRGVRDTADLTLQSQIKVVVSTKMEAICAIERMHAADWEFDTMYLQPEFSRGKAVVHEAAEALYEYREAYGDRALDIRVLGQVHKNSLFVR